MEWLDHTLQLHWSNLRTPRIILDMLSPDGFSGFSRWLKYDGRWSVSSHHRVRQWPTCLNFSLINLTRYLLLGFVSLDCITCYLSYRHAGSFKSTIITVNFTEVQVDTWKCLGYSNFVTTVSHQLTIKLQKHNFKPNRSITFQTFDGIGWFVMLSCKQDRKRKKKKKVFRIICHH